MVQWDIPGMGSRMAHSRHTTWGAAASHLSHGPIPEGREGTGGIVWSPDGWNWGECCTPPLVMHALFSLHALMTMHTFFVPK
jgi:hypothetical protein